jgi:perosamine synthetase
MSLVGPLPRLRIYTTLNQYLRVLMESSTGRAHAGDAVKRLETAVAASAGARHAVAMPLARTGIYFALKCLIKPGQEVVLSPYTIADVVNMVVCAGGVPVFADIERETCNIDAQEVEKLITESTGAVLVTHFYGLACNIRHIAEICRRRNVPLVEDAAQAFGVRVDGQSVGTFGTAGIFSFGMYKNVNSFLGGMVVANDADLDARIRAEIANLPYQPLGDFFRKVTSALQTDVVTHPMFFRLGFYWPIRYAFLNDVDAINNRMKIDVDPKLKTEMPKEYLCRMTPLQARLALSQLDRAEADTSRRIEAAKVYHAGLSDVPELVIPPLRTDFSHMYWYFPIQYADRRALVKYAMRKLRDIAESYHRNCADLPCFAQWHRDCPRARATADSLIYLPTYPRYTRREIEKTVAVIRSYFGR